MTMRLRPSMQIQQIRQAEHAIAFFGAAFAEREQARQPAPGGAVARIGENVRRAVGKDEPRADRDFSLQSGFSLLRATCTRTTPATLIAVGNAEAGEPKGFGGLDQFFRMRTRRAERRNYWSPPVRHKPDGAGAADAFPSGVTQQHCHSRKQSVQVPVRFSGSYLVSEQSFAIEPDARAFLAFDAEIIAGERMALLVAPPFHGDALRPFGMRDFMQHTPPAKAHRRAIRHLGDGLDRLRPLRTAGSAAPARAYPVRSRLRRIAVAVCRGACAGTAATANSGICVSRGSSRATRRRPKRAPGGRSDARDRRRRTHRRSSRSAADRAVRSPAPRAAACRSRSRDRIVAQHRKAVGE